MASNPYNSVSIGAGFNQNPPPDDGSVSAANLLRWQFHLDKIGDPLNAFAAAIDAATLAAFGALILTDQPEEETLFVAIEEMIAGAAAGGIVSNATRANSAGSADTADTLTDGTEQVVVMMEELTF